MMPKRVAETDPNTQISDFTGSGPFVFKKDEWKPGDKAVYVKFDKYKPRAGAGLRRSPAARSSRSTASSGAPSPTTRRPSTRCSPARSTSSRRRRTTCCRCAQGRRQRQAVSTGTRSATSTRSASTSCTSPSTTPRSARPCCYAFNQEDFLKAVIGDPTYYKVCKSYLPVRHAVRESTKGMDGLLEVQLREGPGAAEGGGLRRHADRADALDRPRRAHQPRAGGQDRSWRRPASRSTCSRWTGRRWWRAAPRRTRRPPGGWHAFLTSWVAADILNPIMHGLPQRRLRQGHVRLAVRRGDGEAARRSSRARPIPAKQKAIAEAVQVRETQYPTHIPLGQWYQAPRDAQERGAA